MKVVHLLLVCITMVTYTEDLTCFRAGCTQDKRATGMKVPPTDQSALWKIVSLLYEDSSDVCAGMVG